MQVEIIETTSLGNRGYLVHDESVAIAIDVQRDYSRWIAKSQQLGVAITHVFETHMHNDYVTGGYQLAKEHGAVYVVPRNSGADIEALEMNDLEHIEIGTMTVTGLHTPGHTEHHMSYQVSVGDRNALFTGGGILYGTVGRTDLVSPDKTSMLTHAQFDSARRLGEVVSDDAAVFPTHGFGSFCSSSDGSGATDSTMATEKQINVAFTTDRERFVEQIIAGLGPYPRYYAHMGPMNQAGPPPVGDLHIHEYAAQDIAHYLRADDAWVIDTRSRTAFATRHPRGAIGIELGGSFATYAGWLLPWTDRLVLVGDDEAMLRNAYTELSRIGMDQFVDGATSGLDEYFAAAETATYRVTNFAALKSTDAPMFILDVRLPADWRDERVVGSVNIPLHEVMERIDEIPTDREIGVHCASGYRASIAASILDQHGRKPVLISDDFTNASALGITER